MWELVNERPMTEGLYACHHCDVPPCCNPWHVYAGTQLKNMRDAKQRGRMGRTSGEQNGKSKLNNVAIALIWEMRYQNKDIKIIAQQLGRSRGTIDAVLSGRTWKNISLLYSNGLGLPGKKRGEDNSQAKLKSTDIPSIWQWHHEGWTQAAIARQLHVTRNAIGSVLHYETWKHVSLLLNDHQP
jgi:hypothetical protein